MIAIVSGAFDDLRSRQIRFLEEASKLAELTVLLWSDEAIRRREGRPPKFPQPERLYYLQSIRYVRSVEMVDGPADPAGFCGRLGGSEGTWVVHEAESDGVHQKQCEARGWRYHVLPDEVLSGFPGPVSAGPAGEPSRKKVVVTGCYDWFHSGHARFCEEASAFGDLYVIVGQDANIRLLKGAGHPLFPQEERRYVVGSVRYVKQALVSSGMGWLDADPEIKRLKPDIYVVNEDGDKGGKREYCQQNGLEYRVLKRVPAPGLPGRSSTDLRGF